MDWFIRPGSKIAKMPRPLQPAALLLRNVVGDIGVKMIYEDGIKTAHNVGFRNDPEFRRCYARAVKAGGWDYGIRYRVHQALWCSRLAQAVDGDFVELGTGRGFVMSALLESGVSRSVHLFDTFIPNRVRQDGKQSGELAPTYAVSTDAVRENFAEWANVTLHIGDIYETLPQTEIESVAFLHVDLNHADPEEFGIRLLWPRMPRGAVMLLDDYANHGFEPQFDRANELADELGFSILSTPTGQGIIVKS